MKIAEPTHMQADTNSTPATKSSGSWSGSRIAFTAVAAGLAAALFAWSGAAQFLFSSNYLPHQFCYLAQPGLVWTNVAMDGLIAVSYLAIFAALFWMASRLRPLAEISSYLWIFIAFGTFIVACGMTHIMEIVTVWWPVYRFSAAVKVVCAVASVITAILFVRVAPILTEAMGRFFVMLSATQQEKDRAVASLLAAEKLAIAGRISASIAHEIRNPLEAIGNLLYLVGSDASLSADTRSLIELAHTETTRAGDIARNTLSLYQETAVPTAVSIEKLLEGIIALQSVELARRSIRVETKIAVPGEIVGFPGELRQIVINLVTNSVAAISRNGRISVRVLQRRGGCSITVADNGPGIPPEHRARLFTLFFTTKGEEGTGLGLWLVRSLVEKTGGKIVFRSRTKEEGQRHGTVFNVWMPLEVAPPVANRVAA